jgi:uracil-DNA glycosylase
VIQSQLLDPAWRSLLLNDVMLDHLAGLDEFLVATRVAGTTVYPEPERFFSALNAVPPARVKVVILGQDPYHSEGLATGFAFAVPQSVKPPPSLRNVLSEVQRDLGQGEGPSSQHDLMPWVEQGVLLLNAVLSVSKGVAGSHHGRGWESFTDAVIAHLGARAEPTVFMFWGKAAQRKACFVQRDHHLVLTAPHPSPLSVYRGFAGCGHFSECNQFLMDQAQSPIDW